MKVTQQSGTVKISRQQQWSFLFYGIFTTQGLKNVLYFSELTLRRFQQHRILKIMHSQYCDAINKQEFIIQVSTLTHEEKLGKNLPIQGPYFYHFEKFPKYWQPGARQRHDSSSLSRDLPSRVIPLQLNHLPASPDSSAQVVKLVHPLPQLSQHEFNHL